MSRVIRAIAPDWLKAKNPNLPKVVEGELSDEEIIKLNESFYNIYYLPNGPTVYEGGHVSGHHIDKFNYVFCDFDLKSGTYPSKDAFLATIINDTLTPTTVVDSGNGIHVYWRVRDLDALSYLRLQRRLIRYFKTDEAVGQIYQLMRLPDTINTKDPDNLKLCEVLADSGIEYTSEQVDKHLPKITYEDEQYCQQHYNKTYHLTQAVEINDTIPLKFAKLLESNPEVKSLWTDPSDDRSKADFRLAHIMFASGFSKDEATSVLVNTAKALARAPAHRASYATNIVDKIWTFEIQKDTQSMSRSVLDILGSSSYETKRESFRCNSLVDGTHAGFKRGDVFGLVGGAGVGKTTFALNLFRWFVESHPECVHFFVSLEQQDTEIAARWAKMCKDSTNLHSKVQVLGNYNDDGSYRNLSLSDIKKHILKFTETTGQRVGCVVLDHVGILRRDDKHGETQGLAQIFRDLKSFAVETNTFFVVQSQTNRSKAGIGDIELDKDAAYGSTAFEWYVDYLVTIWAPLKRVYDQAPHLTVTAFKYCKIRTKNVKLDRIQEDQKYLLLFDVDTERFRKLTEDEQQSFAFFNAQATNLRKKDRKTDVSEYKSITWAV